MFSRGRSRLAKAVQLHGIIEPPLPFKNGSTALSFRSGLFELAVLSTRLARSPNWMPMLMLLVLARAELDRPLDQHSSSAWRSMQPP